MQTECNPDLFGFAPVEGRRVEAAVDAGMMTSDARLERGRFIWPQNGTGPADGVIAISPAQLGSLLEGIEMTLARPLRASATVRSWRPERAG